MSVLHCHGVSPSGGCGFARSFLAQEPRFGAGQVAPKSPHFLCSEVTLGTFSPPFLRLLRPSLPWCFPVRGLWFCAVFPRPRTAFWSGTSSSEISSFSMGFRSYVRRFFAAFFAPSPSFTAMVFPVRGLWFCAVFPRPRTAFWSGTSSSKISSFSMGFRSYVRHFFASFFAPSPSFTAKLIVSTENLVKVFKHSCG